MALSSCLAPPWPRDLRGRSGLDRRYHRDPLVIRRYINDRSAQLGDPHARLFQHNCIALCGGAHRNDLIALLAVKLMAVVGPPTRAACTTVGDLPLPSSPISRSPNGRGSNGAATLH
jgi:hypothetical protein